MKKPVVFLFFTFILFSAGCLKEPGTGGTATISGKVYAYDYDDEMVNLRSQYYAPDEDVFIIYGDDSIYSDRTRTSYDGSYRFRYLRPGTYTVFAYSKNATTRLPPPQPVKLTVEIAGDNRDILLPDIEINK